jgi:hypothetical protein
MDPFATKDDWYSLLEAASTWPTEGVFINVYFKNESGEEVSKRVDICTSIGCSSNDPTAKKAHQNDFKKHIQKPESMTKLYLSNEFN